MKVSNCKTGDRVAVFLNRAGGIYWPEDDIKTFQFVIGTILELKNPSRRIIGYRSGEKTARNSWNLDPKEQLCLPGCILGNYISSDVECLQSYNRRILQ